MSFLCWLAWNSLLAGGEWYLLASASPGQEQTVCEVAPRPRPLKDAPPVPDFPKSEHHKLSRVTYKVGDLIAPEGSGSTTEDALIQRITNSVAPDSWNTVGGPGSITYFPLGMALLIMQTAEAQTQIGELLDNLRKQQEQSKEYVLEMRLLEAQPEGEPKVSPFPKVTVFKDRWFKVFTGKTVVLQEGTIRDLLAAPAGKDKADPADEIEVGFQVRGKVSPIVGKLVRLDLVLQKNDLESATRDDIVVLGNFLRTAQRVRTGQVLRQVLEEDPEGEPVVWLEMVVRENTD